MMNIIKKATNNQKAIAVALLVSAAQFAMADGFTDVNQTAITIRNGIYTVVGILATFALLFMGIQGWTGRKDWTDVAMVCFWIVFTAASIAFGAWLWAKGGSLSFG